jgi:N-acetylmuramoyl-L-alanine amidase
VRICLDPGHGGRSSPPGYKEGPTGLREAEVNLRVATFLRDFLEASGAIVFMTRHEDVCLSEDPSEDHRLRAELANTNNCDVFLSIHHNASDTNPNANFTSVWYHGGVDHSPAGLDIARELSTSLSDELRLPQQLGCPVLSDYLVYSRSGFAVLRHARVPAVLTEASFHSNPEEERRLHDPDYNRREAHALFVGLARYAYGGIPRARLVDPADGILPEKAPRKVVIELDDGIRARRSWGWEKRAILEDTIVVRMADRKLSFAYEERTSRLTLQIPGRLRTGPLSLRVQFENLFKHSNTRPLLNLRLEPKAAQSEPSTRPGM